MKEWLILVGFMVACVLALMCYSALIATDEDDEKGADDE